MEDFIKFKATGETQVEPKLKRAQSLVGTAQDKNRPGHDFYPTPPEATIALLEAENFTGTIWEPACGDGAISRVLIERGFDVLSTDLIDRGYGESGHDFLSSPYSRENIVTNPPFILAEDFVRKALASSTRKVAMLVKLQFLEGAKRRILFETTPLKTVHVFSKRVSFYRNGEKGSYSSSMIAFAWHVWEHGYTGKPQLNWI